jgi:hypothetical protein
MEPEVYYRFRNSLPLAKMLSQMNPGRTTPTYFCKIDFSVVASLLKTRIGKPAVIGVA